MTENRILIIDDDEIVINAIVGIIKLLGCTVTFITKPQDALEEIKRTDYDVILVDYKMPVMNGIEFIKCASQFISIEKFILITGYVGL
ncbi:MAG: response regulator, partial [Thermodesulfovibrionales bacterium]|nr:response regulator [Thermodesulfovibrionales bacterium]